MIFSDKLYDVLKWLDMIVIPAAATFYKALSAVWGWPFGEEVLATSAAICALLGAMLGISTAEYNKR